MGNWKELRRQILRIPLGMVWVVYKSRIEQVLEESRRCLSSSTVKEGRGRSSKINKSVLLVNFLRSFFSVINKGKEWEVEAKAKIPWVLPMPEGPWRIKVLLSFEENQFKISDGKIYWWYSKSPSDLRGKRLEWREERLLTNLE